MGARRLVLRLGALPDPALSVNEVSGRHRMVIHKRRQEQAETWQQWLQVAGAQHEEQFENPVHIRVLLKGTGRRTDVSNWVCHQGLKVLVDCLTEPKGNKQYGIGLLSGDGYRAVIGMTVDVEPDGEQETIVEIEEAA